MSESDRTEMEGVAGVYDRAHADGAATGKVIEIAGPGKTFVLVPAGYDLQQVDDHLERPRDLSAQVEVNTLESFMAYLGRHAVIDTAIFADVLQPSLTGIIDYHSASNEPNWRKHKVRYQPKFSDEWTAWHSVHGKFMGQADFVRFLEEHAIDVVEPSGADVLELCQTLEAKKEVNFRSGVRLDNSTQQLTYVEDVEATGGKQKQLKIPTEFVLGIPIFYGNDVADRVKVFFRWAIIEAKLKLRIDIYRPSQVIDTAFQGMLDQVRQDERTITLPLFEGKP